MAILNLPKSQSILLLSMMHRLLQRHKPVMHHNPLGKEQELPRYLIVPVYRQHRPRRRPYPLLLTYYLFHGKEAQTTGHSLAEHRLAVGPTRISSLLAYGMTVLVVTPRFNMTRAWASTHILEVSMLQRLFHY